MEAIEPHMSKPAGNPELHPWPDCCCESVAETTFSSSHSEDVRVKEVFFE